MNIVFDSNKDRINIAKHGISLARASEMNILVYREDTRTDYRETRYRAWGVIDEAYYCLAFTMRKGSIRAISLRPAKKKEVLRHVET